MQRLHLFFHHQREQVAVRCVILLRTSNLRLCLRNSTRDKAWENSMCNPCQNCISRVSSSSRIPCAGRFVFDVFTHRNRAETREACRRHSARERIRTEHQENFGTISVTSRYSSRRRRVFGQECLKCNCMRDCFFRS